MPHIPKHLVEAWHLVGGLSQTTKLPCMSYNLPSSACKVGSRLAATPGTVCSHCYAACSREHVALRSRQLHRGAATNYVRPVVVDAMRRRLESLTEPGWVDAMAELILHFSADLFRWHDAGDLQGEQHLHKICQVCELTPHCRHWIPTREAATLRTYLKTRMLPANLTVRLSATYPNEPPVRRSWWQLTSTVASGAGHRCPANDQGHECLDCRKCWDKRVRNVDYSLI